MAGGSLGAQEVVPIQNWSPDSAANAQYAAGQQQYGYGQPQYQQPPQYPEPQYGQPQTYPQQQYPQQGYPQQPYADPNEAYPPPPYQPNRALNPDQLEQLVAPIALFPDNLVSMVLAASTYPAQVSSADQWLQMERNAPPEQIAAGANAQTTWDPSIKALTAFPQVLDQMAANLQWTTDLGNAYYNQPQDVMQSIQVMRSRAQGAGNLQSTPQEQVTMDQGNIVLAPPSPQVVYVPMYDPWVVYGQPVQPYPGYSVLGAIGSFFGNALISFGPGIAMQAFIATPFGWLGWGLDWLAHAILFNHGTYFSHSNSVHDWGFPHGGARAFRGGYERAGYGRNWGQGGYSRPRPELGLGGARAFGAQSSHGPQPTGRPEQLGSRAFQSRSQAYVGRQQQVARAYGFGNGQNYGQNGAGYGRGSQTYLGRNGSSFSNPPYRVPTPVFGGSRSYAGAGNARAGARQFSGYGGTGYSWSGGRSAGFHGSAPRNDHLQSFNGGGRGFSGYGGQAPRSFGGGHSSWGGGGGFKAPKESHFGGGSGHFGGGHSGGGHSSGGHGHHH